MRICLTSDIAFLYLRFNCPSKGGLTEIKTQLDSNLEEHGISRVECFSCLCILHVALVMCFTPVVFLPICMCSIRVGLF